MSICESCGNPEAEHVWVSEEEVTLWQPEPGFKKNSCARRPNFPLRMTGLVFKIWRPSMTEVKRHPRAKPMPGLDLDALGPKKASCPFCGGKELEEVMNDHLRSMECLGCHAHGPWVEETLEDPLEAWNMRYPSNSFVPVEYGND